jgi:hypothetical protein
MSQTSFEFVLTEALKLPVQQQQQLIDRIAQEIQTAEDREKQEALEIVEKTYGRFKGIDRETMIWLAEDEELSGY